MDLSHDEIKRLSHDLVYQVAYAYYDTPYILLIKLLVQSEAIRETDLAATVGLVPNEVRKYLGALHVHRLVRRYVNKEKQPVQEWKGKRETFLVPGRTFADPNRVELRMRDVIYWYIDYREFANVVKYRLAMMRKVIDERIKQEAGNRGYICPNCGKTYEPLEMNHLFSPQTNSFLCEICSTELVEHDPSIYANHDEAPNQDMMQRFNVATAPIRDALKRVEGIMLPSLNVVVWIANNVKVLGDEEGGVAGAAGETGKRKIEVVVGDEGEERERLERERLAEEQRSQNALPVWHTHSTVTGSATSLGISSKPSSSNNTNTRKGGKEMDDAALAEHYANLVDDDEDDFEDIATPAQEVVAVKSEPVDRGVVTPVTVPVADYEDENDDEEEEEEDEGDGEDGDATPQNGGTGPTVMVGGTAKLLSEITEEDEEEMTPDEYTAYYEAANA